MKKLIQPNSESKPPMKPTSPRFRTLAVMVCWWGIVLGTIQPAQAVLTVTNLNDSGPGSLRQAIADAAPDDTIDFAVTGTITLTSGELVITNDLTIRGPGAANLTVSGNNSYRVFSVTSPTTASIFDLTVANGNGNGNFGDLGGGVYNSGTLTISGCVVISNTNHGPWGGGIFNSGELTVSNSTVSENCALQGGGIWNASTTVTVVNTVISSNHGPDGGGGIFDEGGTLHVLNSVVSSNSCESSGAGICSRFGTLYIGNSSIVGNYGRVHGAGIWALTGLLVLSNSTISGNQLLGSSGWGGGLSFDGPAFIVSSTICSNHAVTWGGGIEVSYGELYLRNSILAGNSAPTGPDCYVYTGIPGDTVLISEDYNLIGNTNGAIITGVTTHNIYSQDPFLGPLANYGGTTLTMPLLNGSPAIDAGDPVASVQTDQRGRTRPYGAACDIGAFESSPPFVVRGKVFGASVSKELTVSADTNSAISVNGGEYSLEGLAPNTYAVRPGTEDYHILPANRQVTVGPDQLGVNFRAYRWNALNPEGVSSGVLHLIYAGTNGDVVRTLASSNLLNWEAISTNTVPSTNLFDIFDATSQPRRFYRPALP